MPTSTLRLPPRTAKNYDAQIIHRFYSIAEQIEQPVDRWVTDANWSVQLAINEAEGRGETIETLDLPSLNTEPLPPIIVEFRQLMRAVLLYVLGLPKLDEAPYLIRRLDTRPFSENRPRAHNWRSWKS
jgi:hypothetical protein